MTQQLDRRRLAELVESEDIASLAFAELVRLFREDHQISKFLPDSLYQIDPRNGDVILYHSARARRPHDNRPPLSDPLALPHECVICQGQTTGILDVADLSQGFTFINKNLFPILNPCDPGQPGSRAYGHSFPTPEGGVACGLHFLQWTSSQHDKDWHNMPGSDCTIVMKRLAALERKLITDSGEFMPPGEGGTHGFVLIVKNHGYLVGGSMSHGHQQIAFSSVMPRRARDNWRFQTQRGETFSAYLMRENPPALRVKDYGYATLLIPYFMRRPFDMMLLVANTHKQYLHQLEEAEIAAVAEGWHDAIRAMHAVMPRIGREIAYNVITSNGPGAGIYFEFLPYTQETGGAEHLGLLVCEQDPEQAAATVRELLRD
jgi:galactose-1-phosphate uridylyltransferase